MFEFLTKNEEETSTSNTVFDRVFDKLINIEGTYSNDPNDTGGETVFGISRNNFPDWEGWDIVDSLKSVHGTGHNFITALNANASLQVCVRNWYKDEFWNPFQLDNIKDEKLAAEIFEQSVNLGRKQTTLFIQRACNAFNYKYMFGSDLVVDGLIGPATRTRLLEVGNDERYTNCLRKALDGLQVNHYINLGLKTTGRSDYRKYMRGWMLNRIGEIEV